MTRPSSEPYCRKRRPPPSNYSGKRISTSPPTSGLRTSSGEQNLHHQHRGATRTSNPTSVGGRGPMKEVHATGPPVSRARGAPRRGEQTLDDILDPSARTTRICAIPYGTAGTSSIPLGMADHFSLYHLPHHEEGPASPGSLNNRKGEGVEHSRASTERSTSSSEDTGRRSTKGSRSSMTDRYWWQPPVHRPPICGQST
jgi:hypothetical protein